MKKTLYTEFEQFFAAPTRGHLRELLEANLGEFDHIDFKADWPDYPKLARHILAVGNSGRGIIVMGVSEDENGVLAPIGLQSLTDKTVVHDGLKKFVPSASDYEIADFTYDTSEHEFIAGKRFQVLFVENKPERIPFICCGDGKSVRAAAIYVRRGKASIEANYEELQRIISRRIDTQESSTVSLSLDEHIAQLERLYQRIPRYLDPEDVMYELECPSPPNPDYPGESFEDFLAKVIREKKRIVESLIQKR